MAQNTLVDEVDKEIREQQAKIVMFERIKKLSQEKYPDLRRYTETNYTYACAAKSANGSVTDFDTKMGCGCCYDPDAQFNVWFYGVEEGIRIYSDPPYFTVGRNNCDNGIIPAEGWEQKLRNANIPESMIQRVREYLEDNTPLPDEEYEKQQEEYKIAIEEFERSRRARRM